MSDRLPPTWILARRWIGCACLLSVWASCGGAAWQDDAAAPKTPRNDDALVAGPAQPAERAIEDPLRDIGPFETPVLIRITGPIEPLLEQYVRRSLSRARERGADIVIIEIDSPGGYLEASLNLAEMMAGIDWATTVAYVPRQAFSGAAIMSLGCDYIVLDPSAQFGDAGPIFQGEDAAFQYVPEKLRSALASQLREIAKGKGRSPALAEAMVDMNLKVFRVRDKQTGDEVLMTQRDLDGLEDRQRWEIVQRIAETGDGRFLTLSGERTVEVGLGELTVSDVDELKTRLHVDGDIEIMEKTTLDVIVILLNTPLITGLLFVIGLVALYVELSAPGIGIGGLLAMFCFLVFFWSRFLGGTAGWLEIILFVSGTMFLLAEFFVIPGFGIAGVTGILLILGSIILASQSFVIPETPRELAEFRQSVVVAAVSGMSFAVIAVWVTKRLGKIPVLNRLALQPPAPAADPPLSGPDKSGNSTSATADKSAAPSLFPVAVGDIGIAESPLRPAGRVAFGDLYVDVITDGSFVDPGTKVRVIEVSGNRVRVRPVD